MVRNTQKLSFMIHALAVTTFYIDQACLVSNHMWLASEAVLSLNPESIGELLLVPSAESC